MENLKAHVFSNGLPTIVMPMPSARAITAILVVGAGSRFENTANNGISRFYTNVCWQGSKNYPNADLLWEATDQVGLVAKTIVQPEYTLFYFSAVPEFFSACFDLFMHIIYQPNLAEANITKEKQLTVTDLNFATRNPEFACLNSLNNLMFNNSSLGFNPLGTMQSAQNINAQALEAFKNQYYVSQNSMLTFIVPESGFDIAKLEPTVTANVPNGTRQVFPAFDFSQTKVVQDKINQQGQVAYVSLANFCYGRHSPKKLAQNLLLQILAEGRTNKRFKTLRDKKIVSLVRPWIKTLDDCGVLTIQAYTTGRQEKEALAAILEQLKNVSSNTIAQAELDRAKVFYHNQLSEKLGSSIELGMFYALSYFFNLEEKTPEEILAKVKNVTLEEINALAQIVCKPEAFSYVTLGPTF